MEKRLFPDYPLQGAYHAALLSAEDAKTLFHEGCGFNVGHWSFCNLTFDGRFVGVCERARGETDEVWTCLYDTTAQMYVLTKRGYYNDAFDPDDLMTTGRLEHCMATGHEDMKINKIRRQCVWEGLK